MIRDKKETALQPNRIDDNNIVDTNNIHIVLRIHESNHRRRLRSKPTAFNATNNYRNQHKQDPKCHRNRHHIIARGARVAVTLECHFLILQILLDLSVCYFTLNYGSGEIITNSKFEARSISGDEQTVLSNE